LADDLQRAVTGQIRMMVVAAYAVLLSELDEQPKTREAVKSTIQKVFSEPSKVVASWEVLTQPKMSLALNVGTEIIGRYHDVWLQFKRRVDALPEVLDWDRGIPYSSHANHPSDLVQRLSRNQMWGVAEIIEDLVTDFPTKTDGSTDSEN
jgi:Tfp pilus assembly protein PilO